MSEGSCGLASTTLLHTKEGLKPIQNISVGDFVLSYPDDQRTPNHQRQEHEYIYRKVTRKFVMDDQSLSKLIVSNLASGARETIFVSADLPIFHKDRGWVPVANIEVGDGLENYLFGNLLVFRIYHAVENARVYNLEIDGIHTCYAGEQGVWVHT